MIAKRLGIAVSMPISSVLFTPMPLMMLGIQKPTPYRPMTKAK